MENYRELESWNRAMELMTQAYALSASLTGPLPPALQQAALTVPARIAAACGGDSRPALSAALGSVYEVETLLFAGVRLRQLTREQIDPALALTARIAALIHRQLQKPPAPAYPAYAPGDPPPAYAPAPAAQPIPAEVPRADAKPVMHWDAPDDASPELRAALAALHTDPTETLPDEDILTDADW